MRHTVCSNLKKKKYSIIVFASLFFFLLSYSGKLTIFALTRGSLKFIQIIV